MSTIHLPLPHAKPHRLQFFLGLGIAATGLVLLLQELVQALTQLG
ncbi:hypothetical protein [Azovibrio restrictus]|nr:hypothetical protein [Azovibrio restrictus]MDD3482597.1 hypothetical protein [Azovibrio restrictus]